MSSSIETSTVHATNTELTADTLTVDLDDGRSVSAPLAWYPRLLRGTAAERGNWRLIGCGEGIHWPDLDEDISVESLIFGRKSGESPDSLRRWEEARTAAASTGKSDDL